MQQGRGSDLGTMIPTSTSSVVLKVSRGKIKNKKKIASHPFACVVSLTKCEAFFRSGDAEGDSANLQRGPMFCQLIAATYH